MQTHEKSVWVVDDDASIRWVLNRALQKAGMQVTEFAGAEDCLAQLQRERPAAVVTDVRMGGMDGFKLLEDIKATHPGLAVIVTTAHSDLDSALTAYQQGAFDYLPKPFDVNELTRLVKRAVGQSQLLTGERAETLPADTDIIGAAPAMQDVFRAIGRLSHASMTVLLTGESGTGKELVARALHRHSPRSGKPFVAINTAAIPRDLLESELFGHERGAFTGAESRRIGRFEQADGGTLFLDE
ncbi:MAG: sigma 54-interacting transcriptional regulator, partial [Gammaproteobacteria bacterium]|nr:sigma 54-interacting transcriptional regulator [Gammaproteobacteria bacterium]